MTAETSPGAVAPNADVVEIFPLAPIQFGLVFEGAASGRPWVNLEQIVCWFDDEELDVERMHAAWHRVQTRHAALRTSIEWQDPRLDEPVQVVHREASMPFEVVDWTAVTEPDVDLERFLAEDRETGVDLEIAPAMRVVLFQCTARRWILVWTFPHAMLDGRSFTIVLDEVFDAYDGVPQESEAPPPEPAFREHVEAVRHAATEETRAFFTELLDGVEEAVPVPGGPGEPADEPGHPGSGRRHGEHELRVPADLVARLEARAATVGATLGTVLLSAWAVMLSRYASRLDVIFGCTRSGRYTHAAGALLVGCLINTVPFRVRPRPDRTVDDLLTDVRSLQVALRPHEQASLMDVRTWSSVPNDKPLLTTNVVFERELLDTHLHARPGRWSARRVAVKEETAFPLGLAAYEDDGLLLKLEFETGRYYPATIERMGGHLAGLLESIAHSREETEVGMLRMLPPEERSHLLDDRNPEPVPAPARLVPDAFEQVAQEHGSRTAVVHVADGDGDGEIDYRGLDAAANRLAHHLLARGAAAGPVAICVPRSPGFVEAVLASLKAGVPYLPIDPSYPNAALHHMLDDSRATLVVTTAAFAPSLPVPSERLVVLDDPAEAAAVASQPTDPPPRAAVTVDSPAYVIYTSGSTGRPKGVVVSHGALAHYCEAVARRYELTPADRALQFSALSFDVSIEELLPTLLVGATVVLRSEVMAESMAALLDVTEREGITVLNLPTAFWHTLVDHLEQGADDPDAQQVPPCLRLLVTGGERASRRAFDTWRSLVPDVRWLNGYGPTETTVTCTVYDPSDGPELAPGEELPIGRPLANTRAYVLGTDGQWLMPDGMVGELWIGGVSVALGYLGQAELTDERFRPDPFNPAEGARMYRTGDLARWLPGGDLEFLGRVDRQLKVRGYRIEPGEVEAALEHHPSVRRAFVAARPTDAGDVRLIGWVVPAGAGPLDLDDVLASARHVLPAHLVPSALVRVERLVRTPGGKVDVAALPSPEMAGMPIAGAPSDPGAEQMVELYRAVLGWDGRIGPDDSFFDLGGHSLLAVRLLGRIEREHGVRLSLATLHEGPTPRRVWAAVQAAEGVGVATTTGTRGQRRGRRGSSVERPAYLVSIQPEGDRPPIFGVHVLGTNACYYRPLAARLGPDQPVLGLSITEPSDETPTAIAEIAGLYAEEIERYHPEGPLSLAAVSMGGYVAFELAHQLRMRGREVVALALFDAQGPGGRASVSRGDRARIHLRQLRSVGPRYLVGRAQRVAEVTRERTHALRLRAHRSLGRETPEELWMHQFVMANVRAADLYEAAPYPGRLIVFRAAGELFDAPEAAATGLGWSPVAAGRLDVVTVPGQHMTMLVEPAVATLAAELQRSLDDAR